MAARKKTFGSGLFAGEPATTAPAAKNKGDAAAEIVAERTREVVRAGKKLQVRLARRRAVRTR